MGEGAWSEEAAGWNMDVEGLLDEPLKEARQRLCAEFEQRYLRALLKSTRGRIGEAAERAGIDARTLYGKMREYGLQKEQFRS
jgi:DNA-binding NtrC family response regulator